MAEFVDKAGRRWGVYINVGQIRRVRNETGVDLNKMFDEKNLAKNGGQIELLTDVCLFADVLYVLVSEQAKNLGVTPEMFAEGLDGDVIEAASLAFLEAYADFFPNRLGKMMRLAIKKSLQEREEMIKKVEKELAGELNPPSVT